MRQWIPMDWYRITEMEEWLKEMAQKGWRLTKIGRFFTAQFEQMEPGRLSYHIEPKAEENKAAFEELGWTYICDSHDDFEIYATTRKTPKLPEAAEEAVRRLKKKQWSVIGSFVFTPLLLIFAFAFASQYYAGQAITLLKDDAMLGLFLVLIIDSIYEIGLGLRRRRLLIQWENGKLARQTARHRTRARTCILLAALLLAEGILFLVRQGQQFQKPLEELAISYVTLEELEGAEVAGSNTAKFETSLMVPKQYDLRMNEGSVPMLQIQLYEVAASGLAAPMLEGLMEAKLSWSDFLRPQTIEAEGVDEAYTAAYSSIQYLFLRSGRFMAVVFYSGTQELVEKADLFVSMLEEFQ